MEFKKDASVLELEKKIDKQMSEYAASGNYTKAQLDVIREGLTYGVDVTMYDDPELSDLKMREKMKKLNFMKAEKNDMEKASVNLLKDKDAEDIKNMEIREQQARIETAVIALVMFLISVVVITVLLLNRI